MAGSILSLLGRGPVSEKNARRAFWRAGAWILGLAKRLQNRSWKMRFAARRFDLIAVARRVHDLILRARVDYA
jgi:hypothetical protein